MLFTKTRNTKEMICLLPTNRKHVFVFYFMEHMSWLLTNLISLTSLVIHFPSFHRWITSKRSHAWVIQCLFGFLYQTLNHERFFYLFLGRSWHDSCLDFFISGLFSSMVFILSVSGAQIKEEIKRERCICLYCRKWNLSFDSNFIKTTNDISLDSQISL